MKKFITFTWACTIALILAGMCEMSSFDNGIQKYSYVKNVKAETVKNHEKNQSIILNAPTVKVKDKTEKQVKIKWNRVKKANSYKVYRATTKGGTYSLLTSTTAKNYVDTNTVGGQKYYYKVQAVRTVAGSMGESSLSKAKYVKAATKDLSIVVAGECYVEGIELWAKNQYPKGTHFVSSVGVSSSGFINTKKFKVNGKSATGIEKVASYNPDRVYFLIGMNESGTDNTTPTINNFKTMINKLKKKNKNVQIVLLPIAPTGKRSTANVPKKSQRLKFNKAYSDLAAATDNVYYYDYTGLFDDGKGYLKSSCDGGDGCHWTSTATINFSKSLMDWSKNNL